MNLPGRTGRRRREAHPSGVGAIVCGGCYLGLGIVRSLGHAGVPVCVIDDERSIARFSRYATHSVRVPDLRDEEQIVDTVLRVGDKLGLQGWVLFPTREEMVAAFARHRDVLEPQFRIPTPPWNTVQWAWDKRKTYRLADELGIPIPRTWYPRTLADLAEIDGEPPFALKPAIKEHFIYETKAKAWRANDAEELAERFTQAAAFVPEGEIMVQEMIPGDGRQQFAFCAFFKEGESVGSMVARRRRQHPPEFGRASTLVETVEIPLLEELSERFLRAIDCYGLVEVEYKLDPRDDRFKLLDVNLRAWGYHTLGPRAGVDFPYMVFADQVNEPVDPRRAQPGIRWIRLVTDVPTGAVEIAGRRVNWRAYLRSLKGLHVEAVFSREDPLPGLVEVALIPYLYVRRGF
jgi:D-aspartate ligase